MAKQFTLGKKERLKSLKQIEKLFREGKKLNVASLRVHYLFNDLAGHSLQLGVGVSHKNFRQAVDRNKIKRLLKEAWRLQKLPLQQKVKEKKYPLRIFIVYTGKEIPGYHYLYDGIRKIMEKLDRIIESAK